MAFRDNFNNWNSARPPTNNSFGNSNGGFRKFGESRFSDRKELDGLNADNGLLRPINFENALPFRKNFYTPPAQPKSKEEVDRILSKLEITIAGRDSTTFQPIETFAELGFPDFVMREIAYQGFTEPTGIQSAAFPIATSGRNLIGIAKTGSGKTLAYLLPALIHLNDQKTTGWKAEGPIALVLAPTRELAQQIQTVAQDFGTRHNITNACIFGGAPKSGQTRELSRNVDIVIATPGRLIDFLQRDVTNLRRCTYLVLDEADRMLDMGFLPQIKKIMSQIRPDRQVLMFSATWPKEMQILAKEYISDYIQLNIGTTNYAANNNIQQIVDICEESEKDEKLMRILQDISNQEGRKTIIFVETKRRADEIMKNVNRRGFNAVSIHGDKSQSEREISLNSFRNGRMNVEILVATDVASRGLDVDDVKYVINYDYPNNSQDYIHRIGRTGRCSQTGTAYTLFTKENSAKASELIKVLTDSNQTINPKLYEMTGRGGGFGMRNVRGRRPIQGGSSMMMRKPLSGGYNREQPREYGNVGMKRQWNDANDGRSSSSSLSAVSQQAKRPYTGYESRQDTTKAPQPLFVPSQATPSYGTSSASYASPPPISSYVQSTSIYSSFPHLQMPQQAYIQYPTAIGTAPPPSYLSFPPPPISAPK